jgi:hypothetical protein
VYVDRTSLIGRSPVAERGTRSWVRCRPTHQP